MDNAFTIGRLSKESGVKVQTIRYYEEIAMMPEPMRSGGNQRLYGDNEVARLKFIRHARDLGFGLPAIRELLELGDAPDAPCAHADEIARRQLEQVEEKIAQLTGGKYFQLHGRTNEMERLLGELKKLTKVERKGGFEIHYKERYLWFLFPAFLLLLLASVLGDRVPRRRM